MNRLRVSAISYLNTAPLMWDFVHTSVGDRFDISYTIPSKCAAALRERSADIGIIPAAAYTKIPGLAIIPDIAIASLDAVRSILLVGKVPMDQIKTVAADTSSMTSVALLQLLLTKWFTQTAALHPAEPNLAAMLENDDAALLIGDPALEVDRSKYHAWDLGSEWRRFTGLPFVFAFWAVRRDAIEDAEQARELIKIFQESRDHGLQKLNLDAIAKEWSTKLRLKPDSVLSYLTTNIHYQLDAACLEGLRLYYRYAEEVGALPRAPDLQFL